MDEAGPLRIPLRRVPWERAGLPPDLRPIRDLRTKPFEDLRGCRTRGAGFVDSLSGGSIPRRICPHYHGKSIRTDVPEIDGPYADEADRPRSAREVGSFLSLRNGVRGI